MKIFVAGATGAIGRPLIALLLAQGHNVVVLTRSSEKAQTLAEQGVESAITDVFDADAVKAAISSVQPEVVIEQLTSLPKTYTGESMSAAAALNTRICREGGANVLAAAQAAGVRRYLRQSIAFWAVPGAGLADEETPLAFDASPAVAGDILTVTEIERRLLGNPNIEGIALRYGFFYGPGTGWEIIFCVYTMISLNSPAFLDLNQSRQIETEVQEDSSVDFSNHKQWNQECGWKNILNNLRLIIQPLLLFWLIYPWLDIFPNSHLLLGFNHLIAAMNQFKPCYASG